MTQDIIVTLMAFGTLALFAARWWRRRGRHEPACASCESSGAKTPTRLRPSANLSPRPEADVKPVAFFGSSGKRRIH
jgi:hypothetical protein